MGYLALLIMTASAEAGNVSVDCKLASTLKASAIVAGRSIDMMGTGIKRLPYAMDIRLDVLPTVPATTVIVEYELDRAASGPRSGRVVARTIDGCTWSAAMPKLHVNETGTFTVDQFSKPQTKTGSGKGSPLATNFLAELASIPSGLAPKEFRAAALMRARAAVSATFVIPEGARIVARNSDGSFQLMEELLATSVVENLSVKNIVSDLLLALFTVSNRAQVIIAANAVQPPPQQGCAPGATVAEVRLTAQEIVNARQPGALNAILTGAFPWPECVETMLRAVETLNRSGTGAVPAAADNAQVALAALAQLRATTALTGLLSVVQRAEALEQAALGVATIDLPVGGDILERYMQSDVMTVILPGKYHLIQPFATASLYAFRNWSATPLLTSPVEPQNWTSDRFALQFGYPIGKALHPADEPFDPQYLVGAQYRLNSVLSLSAGNVVAKISGSQKNAWYFATNLDVSNLGPFQQLFARRDQP